MKTQRFRKRCAESDQFLALTASAFGPACDKTVGRRPTRFNLLHLFQENEISFMLKEKKVTVTYS